MRRPWARPGLALAAGIVAAVSLPGPATAQRSLVIERLHARVEVQRSGELVITETLHPRFTGEWNGILRHLNLNHTTASGARERLDVELVSATDGDGDRLRSEVNQVNPWTREFKVWVPDARNRTAEVVLRYRVRGALRYFSGAGEPVSSPTDSAGPPSPEAGPAGDYDELYWQVTGTEWEVPIESASAEILLPPGVLPLQSAGYQGHERSSAPAPVTTGNEGDPAAGRASVRVASEGRLDPGEGLTVAVAWPAGTVAVPAGVARARPVTFGPTGSVDDAGPGPVGPVHPLAWLPAFLPLLAFWLSYRAWDRRGRDPKARAITVRWEPPEDLSPAEAGTLVDHDPGMHDIISTLVDLAVRGYVVIAEREKKGLFKLGKDYAFHLVRPRSDWGDLAPHERRFLDGLFKTANNREVLANIAEEGSFLDGLLESVAGEPASDTAPGNAIESVFLSDLRNQFYKEIPGIKDALLEALVAKQHYQRRPDKVRGLWTFVAIALFFLGASGLLALGRGTGTGMVLGIALLAGGVLSGVIVGIFGWLMPARTERGARTREAALGFKRFLERVESPRYRRMIRSPDQFERYLPWAMAFRCEDRWAEAFDDILTEPPNWYHGTTGGFRASAFAGDLGTLASTASSTMASSPSSSGSGGGGSVGGGSGGGGGGGF
jgi:uncharacterized membrane protein YgcG